MHGKKIEIRLTLCKVENYNPLCKRGWSEAEGDLFLFHIVGVATAMLFR